MAGQLTAMVLASIELNEALRERDAAVRKAERERILALLDHPQAAAEFRAAWQEANQWPDGPGRRVPAGLEAVKRWIVGAS